uniref:Uncharacterized protein n=1 Tax=Zea mays TaxID=4577 RepID=C4JBM7_MAIZE|nr:unknown [Zea mays]
MRAACACSGRPPTTTRCAWYEDRLAALRSRLCAFWCPPSACELKNLRRQKLQENTLCGGGLAADPDPDPDSESAEQLAASGDGDGDGDSLAPSVRFSHAAPSPCCSLVSRCSAVLALLTTDDASSPRSISLSLALLVLALGCRLAAPGWLDGASEAACSLLLYKGGRGTTSIIEFFWGEGGNN